MLLILPIGTDNPLRKQPIVNYALIALNIAIWIYIHYALGHPNSLATHDYILSAKNPQLHQFITYGFLHANWGHVLGNMFFLYIFGNNVNERLGNLGYILLYLGGIVFSAIGHLLTNNADVLGASGAVAAVTGAYLVLFPKTYVHVLYWIFFFVNTMEVSALYFILFKLIFFDNFLSPAISKIPSNIAFTAHLAGYLFGIGVPLLLLALKLLPHSQFDLWALVKRWRQRQLFASVTRQGYDPFKGQNPDQPSVSVKVSSPQITQIRAQINQAITESNLENASLNYIKLIELDPEQIMPQQPQLDIANKLMHSGKHKHAAHAYEKFLKHYPKYPFVEQVQLMLGLLYSRYLHQPAQAKLHLESALPKLTDPGQKQMCQDEINRINN